MSDLYSPGYVRALFDEMAASYGIINHRRLMLGTPDNYRLLGVYMARFGNCDAMRDHLGRADLQAEVRTLFFGCATAVVGRKGAAETA